MKKIKLLVVALAAIGLLVACSSTENNGKGGATTKSKIADVTIEGGTFIEPIGGDKEEEQDVIALNMKVKNTSKEKLYIFDDSFYLVEKGEDDKIKPLRLDYESNLENISGEISPGKSLSGTVVFAVKEDVDYQLIYSSSGIDEKGKAHSDVEMKLDLKKFSKTKEQLDEPVKAVQAYIDVVLLQKENNDYDSLIANDAAADIEMVKKEYARSLKDTFYRYRATDDDVAKAFESYVGNQSEAVEITITSVGNVGKRAKVAVDFKGISSQAVSDLIRDLKEEYNEKNKDYDSEKQEQYALSKLEEVYSQAEIGEPRRDMFIILTKKEDKWFIDFKSDDSYENKGLLNGFLGDVD